MLRFFTLLIFFIFMQATFAQNIDYNTSVVSFYGSTCGNDPGFSTTEEHTWKAWLDDAASGSTYSGCIQRNINGSVNQTGTYASRSRSNTSVTSMSATIDAWEDDNGGRCDYGTGIFVDNDDCRVNTSCTYNFSDPLEYQWTDATNTCGSSDYSMNVYREYRYSTVTLANAVEEFTQSYNTGGTRPFWGSRGSWSYSGNDCATSATITHNQNTSFSTYIECKSQLSFRWRVSSEANFDKLEVYINGVRRQTISGTVGWTLVTLNLDFGSNMIEWRYTKDGSVNVGEDRGYVDDISYIDATTLNPGTISGIQLICAGDNPTTLASTATPQVYSTTANYQWQYSNNGISGWTNIAGKTSLSYDPPNGLTQTRYYRRRTQDLCGNTDYSNAVEVTVNQLPNGSLDGSTTICEGNSTNLSFNASAGTGPWDIIYNGIGLNTISSGTNISVSPTGNTTYTLSAITDNNGCVRTVGFVADASIIVHTNSTNPVIGLVANKHCPNTDIILTASSGISGTGASIEWYTGPNGTGSNLGSGANITVNPSSNTTYYARREGACNTTSDASQAVDVRDFVYTATGMSSSAGYCTDKDGWHHFYNTSDEIIFSLQGDLSGTTSTPIVTINNHGTYHQGTVGYVGSCNVGLSPGEQFFEMQRAWNLDFTGTLNPPYSLRSYFPAAEKTAIENAAAAYIASNPSCNYIYKYTTPNGFYWFKNTGATYTAPLYDQPTKLSASAASINGMNYAEISGVTSFSGGSGAIALSPDPSLPVELVSFEGWNTPLGNQLQWITFSETNNAHFVVQHSTDPLLGFENIGQVNGAGTTTSSKSYEFLHDNPMLGDNYYRLKQVDINGAFGYSNVIVLKVEGSINRSVFYPNPTLDILNYQFTNKENQQLHITISNVLGQTISSRYLSAQEGLNSYQLNLSSFSSGVYNVHVYREDGLLIATQKITKKTP